MKSLILVSLILLLSITQNFAQESNVVLSGKELKEASALRYAGLGAVAIGATVIYIGNSGDSRMEEGTMWTIGAVSLGSWLVCDIFAWRAIRRAGTNLEQAKPTTTLQLTPTGLVYKF